MAKTVVILGAAFGGLHVAHALLKKNKNIKIIIVTKNSHFYWNMASVRAIVPNQIKDDQLFQPVEKALKRYPTEQWELIIGSAEHADFAAKTVEVKTNGTRRTIPYDQLVLATGSRSSTTDVPWKTVDSYEETVSCLHETRDRVQAAHHIVVGGAGTTGVEVAGELGHEYGSHAREPSRKEITILSRSTQLMSGDALSDSAQAELKKLGVTVRTDATVEHVHATPGGKTEIRLANGEKLSTDLYLPTTGLTPNSEYIDARYLNEERLVVVDDCYRVRDAKDVWALGDIVSRPRAGFFITKQQAAGVVKNIEAVLKEKEPTAVKGAPVDVLACSVGRSRGVGRVNSFKLFSFIVWAVKGRNLGLNMMQGYMDGAVA